jgi:hypothetical protein
LTLQGGVAAIEYPTLFWEDNSVRHSGFTDTRADATIFGEYRVLDNVGINATVRYTTNVSNAEVLVNEPPAASPNLYGMGWTRFEAYLGARWFM